LKLNLLTLSRISFAFTARANAAEPPGMRASTNTCLSMSWPKYIPTPYFSSAASSGDMSVEVAISPVLTKNLTSAVI